MKKYNCKNKKCKNKISEWTYNYGLGFCNSCAGKYKIKKYPKILKILLGKHKRNYKHGKYCKDKHYYCIDCHKEIRPVSKRCIKCLIKYRKSIHWKPGNYKGGFKKCIDCGRKLHSYSAKRCISCASKIKSANNWKNPKFRKKVIKILIKNQQKIIKIIHNSPNLIEKKLMTLIPKNFIFVGNGKIMIDRFNPDFIDKKNKKIIELYGDYWHNLPNYIERDKRRLKSYKKYGYKTLVIWEHELKDLNKIRDKIYNFNII